MLKLILWTIKTAVFATVILIAAQFVGWGGKTVNQRITGWTKTVRESLTAKPIQEKVAREVEVLKSETKKKISKETTRVQSDLLSATERMKLRSLLKQVGEE